MKMTVTFQCKKCDRTVTYKTDVAKLPSVVKCEACGKQTAI